MTETAEIIERYTEAVDGGRVFKRPDGKPQFRIAPTLGGYFMEESAGGRWWTKRAWRLTDQGINAEDIPDGIWGDRHDMARQQAEAIEAIEAAGLSKDAPLADLDESEEPSVLRAARTLRGLRWLLVWPEDVVAAHISAYASQWAEAAARARAGQPREGAGE